MTYHNGIDCVDKFPWEWAKCRHGDSSPVAGLYYFPEGCICFPDKIQALCAQHAIRGLQNNEGFVLYERDK